MADILKSELSRRTFVSLSAASIVSAADIASGSSLSSGKTKLNRPILSWSIWWESWFPNQSFNDLTSLINSNHSVIDEVCLWDSPGHGRHVLGNEYAATLDQMAHRFDALRGQGIRVGAFVTASLGHGDMNLGDTPKMQVPPMIGIDGVSSRGTACPTRPQLHQELTERYSRLALTKPDFIVVADDVRMAAHAPVNWGCFCPECLRFFTSETGKALTRQELAIAFDDPANGKLRRAWIEHNARAIESVYRTIGSAVRALTPDIQLGAETLPPAFSSYDGAAYERWFEALRGSRAKTDFSFYSDSGNGPGSSGDRFGLVIKAFDTARQSASYPAQVIDRRYELETIPDGILQKEPKTYINELAISFASARCNGADIQALGAGPFHKEYQTLFSAIQEARPYLDKLYAHAADIPTCGLWAAWSANWRADRWLRPSENWLSAQGPYSGEPTYDRNLSVVLAHAGLPLSVTPNSMGSVLAGRVAETLTDNQLEKILRGGVLMDGVAANILITRGFSDLLGVRSVEDCPDHSSAQLTQDPLNGDFAGAVFAHMFGLAPAGFSNGTIKPIKEEVRTLATLQDSTGSIQRGACMTAFANAAGGRVVVSTFSPWWHFNQSARRFQLLEVADWISGGQLPIRMQDDTSLVPFVQFDAERQKGAVTLLNTGLSPIPAARIQLRIPNGVKVRVISPNSEVTTRVTSNRMGLSVTLYNVPAWSTVSLFLG